jgi:uncharacterized membrane protein YhhN
MFDHWPWYVLLMAVINWLAVERKWKLVEYVAKPGTMILLLLWVALNAGLGGALLWFTLGGILSLFGDVFLMLPGNFFIPGLVSFLLAHVSYIIGLNAGGLDLRWQSVTILLGLIAISYWLYGKLASAMNTKGQQSFKAPVLVYVFVISLMVFSALLTGWRDPWMGLPALLVSLGAVLFYASDGQLAWDKFVQPLPHARLRVMLTYHLGQFGIFAGALLMVLGS